MSVEDADDILSFQFPSNGKAYPKFVCLGCGDAYASSFQFPSNGKAYPKCIIGGMRLGDISNDVSIPFKRESVSKGNSRVGPKPRKKFQFPSNGKAYPKSFSLCLYVIFNSFNSLQTGKRIQRRRRTMDRQNVFQVSIPFKRESVSKDVTKEELRAFEENFQFPSNGKAYTKLSP